MSEEHVERRKVTCQSEIDRLEKAFTEHYIVDEKLHIETNTNMKNILDRLADIGDMLKAWNNVQGFVKVMRAVGLFMKWITIIGAGVSSIWWLLHGGKS